MSVAWFKANLNEICRPKQWKTISTKDLQEEGFPVYGANGIIGYYHSYTHENPTLMITCRGATCGTINLSGGKAYINGNAMALDSLDESSCLLRFLMYFLRYRGLDDTITGSAQPQITRTSLAKVEIPLPPLEEQRRIAAILDKADAARRKRKEAIALTEELLRSAFLEMFGDPVTNPKGWRQIPLGELLAEPLQNGAYFPRERYVEAPDGVEMVHMSDAFYNFVERGSLKRVEVTSEEFEKYQLISNDVLVARRSLNYEGSAKPCLILETDQPLIFQIDLKMVSRKLNLASGYSKPQPYKG